MSCPDVLDERRLCGSHSELHSACLGPDHCCSHACLGDLTIPDTSPTQPPRTPPGRDRARAPTVLLLNSGDPAALRHSLPALADLPTAAMPLAAQPSGLPALGWQLPAARSAVQQLLAAGEWLRARVAAAQYAHLPLASIGGDWILDAADALYARQLRECGAAGCAVGGRQVWVKPRWSDTAQRRGAAIHNRHLCRTGLQARRGTCCGRPTPRSRTWTPSRWAVRGLQLDD